MPWRGHAGIHPGRGIEGGRVEAEGGILDRFSGIKAMRARCRFGIACVSFLGIGESSDRRERRFVGIDRPVSESSANGASQINLLFGTGDEVE